MKRTTPPLPIDDCLQIIGRSRWGQRNQLLWCLRLSLRVVDIQSLKTIASVLDAGGVVRRHILTADGQSVQLDVRSRSLIYFYLATRFRTVGFRQIDRSLPLFFSEKDTGSIRQIRQLFWALDRKLLEHAVAEREREREGYAAPLASVQANSTR